jgi:hypothetical protein
MNPDAGMSVSLSLNTRDFRSKNPAALIPVPVLCMVAEVGENASFHAHFLENQRVRFCEFPLQKEVGLSENSKILLAKNLYYY